ncbi:pyruvate, water dikinase regulatory protein [Atopococcus tabaci]|uniref:pyruvate, water dikinase regulatory protein n=1 Tax=Atopococcus tabaci TaxID=269774 RepID=UPI000421D922|nr:pyruvate, water dikinase regulatory protein [Atopococcus tabaci]
MTEKTTVRVCIISDSIGGTGIALGQAALAQFPELDAKIENFSFVRTRKNLLAILEKAARNDAIILYTLVDEELSFTAQEFCANQNLTSFDLLSPIVSKIAERAKVHPSKEVGAQHALDKQYFDRIRAIEFAVKYDDGKDPKGFLEADIVILGISRTSKTPLSVFLANKGYKVANLPLIPESTLPAELWEVDPSKIVGLISDRSILSSIRQERMRSYGLNPDNAYSSLERIDREIKYAEELYEELGCLTINVSNKSIEETSTIILSNLPIKKKI